MQLLLDVAPNVTPDYRRGSAGALGILLTCVREELDRIVERRAVENRALRSLFVDAAPVVADADLRRRLEAGARTEEPGLRVSQLEAANQALRALLIELHAHVEELDSPEARRVEGAIWRELAASTERRRLSLGMF